MFSSSLQTIQSMLTIELPKLKTYQQRSLQRQDQYIQHLLQQTEDKLLQQQEQQSSIDQFINESSTPFQNQHLSTTATTTSTIPTPSSTNLSQDELILQLLSSIPINTPTISQLESTLHTSNQQEQQQEQQLVLTDQQLQLHGQLQIMVNANNHNNQTNNNTNIFDTTPTLPTIGTRKK